MQDGSGAQLQCTDGRLIWIYPSSEYKNLKFNTEAVLITGLVQKDESVREMSRMDLPSTDLAHWDRFINMAVCLEDLFEYPESCVNR